MFQTVAIIISLAITAVAVTITTLAVRQMLGVLRQGQPVIGRRDQPVQRTVTMLKETFGHTRMLQWTWVGIMHWFVYAAFLILSTAVATAYVQLFDPEFVLPIIGHWYPVEWTLEFIGLLSTIGIIYLIIYRQKHHPRSLGRQSRFFGSTMWQAYFVEAFALLEGGAILFIRGAEYKLTELYHGGEHGGRGHFPLSSYVGDALYPDGEGALENIIFGVALFKIVLAMIWLIVISRNLTMGVAWHRFTAWPNIWFKREGSGRTALGAVKPLTSEGKAITLDDIDDLDEDATLGVGSFEDFSWKGILDFTTCTECGRCQSQCPAWNTEKPLSPKLLITGLRDHAYAMAAGDESAQGRTLIGTGDRDAHGDGSDERAADWFYNPEGGAFVIDEDVLWNCTSCGACVQQCPVDIEHVDHIIDMRRYQVLVESNFPAELNGLFKGLENKGNPWSMSPTARLDWAKGLDFEVKVVGDTIESLDEVEWLFWVGCAGAYEDRAKKTTRAVAELLDMAGVSFGVLGNGETCTGDPARRAGNEFVFQGLAQQNVEVLTEAKAKKVVSTCAHCFNTLKNEYSEFGIELEVVHHTQLLNRLVREGKLTPVKEGAGAHKRSITYHDPCYIGRHNGVYTPPRELLQILPGATYVEMERNSERSFCCGAGGARLWMEENIGSRINMNRTDEAVATGADQIAVGCPFCRVMLSDGLTMKQSRDEAREEVEILDVAQMLLASVKGEQATKLAPGAGAATKAAEAKAAPAAPEQDVATKAEPEAGDVTITDDTVVATEDAGPLAKASGGSSLFDDPAVRDEPAATADEDKTPAEEAQAAKPASSGGSLFDLGADEPADEKPAGGSLFDLGGDEPKPAKAEAKTEAKTESKTETDSEPAADLGSGGSLFDLQADEPEAKAAAAPEPAAVPAPEAASPAAPAAPAADLGSGGSLFDIAAPQAPAAHAASEPAEPAEPAEPVAAVEPEPEPAATPAATASPSAEIPDGGSLFDIQAPEPVAAAAPVEDKLTEPEPKSEPEPTPAPTDTEGQPGTLSGGAAVSAAATAIASDAPTPEPETATVEEADALVEETPAEPEPEPEPQATAEPTSTPQSSGEAHQPRTDVEIGEGSLFDL
ncbi:(Fe-S)-binding protein [Nocardioides rubriscoriae]|uniref:(Fe-S)-binding protein n=1 Tax=Nocardioides rubriscoriae TaxID=642762 RepID=UPI0011DF7781|nr:(Fe-S)-binding protein [Nocardioides rubriscoriae]